MISRRFILGAFVVVPAAGLLAQVPGAHAAGIGGRPGDMALGDPDAPVTVIEFFSLTCPHCRWFHQNIYDRLKPDYVDTGKVRYVFRDFPLNLPALQASILARCAGRDRYAAFVDVLFQAFDDWASASNYTEKLAQIGELGGVSRDRFEACLADKKLENAIFQAIADAQAEYDVSSTPTVIVNGEKYEGKMRFESFAEHIDRLL